MADDRKDFFRAQADVGARTQPIKGTASEVDRPTEPLSFEPQITVDAPRPTINSLYDLGLVGPEGDSICARDFADRLLRPLGPGSVRRDARLLLTALCLHLSNRNGPDATTADLLTWLEAGRRHFDAFRALRDSPMELLRFAYAELLDLSPEAQNHAVNRCISAAKLFEQ